MGQALDDEWLVARYRIDPSLWVIRCYGCISEWALRVSEAGRTVEWRDRMVRGRERAADEPEWLDPMSTPLPLTELPEELAGTSLPDDSEIDYGPWIDLRNMALEERNEGRRR